MCVYVSMACLHRVFVFIARRWLGSVRLTRAYSGAVGSTAGSLVIRYPEGSAVQLGLVIPRNCFMSGQKSVPNRTWQRTTGDVDFSCQRVPFDSFPVRNNRTSTVTCTLDIPSSRRENAELGQRKGSCQGATLQPGSLGSALFDQVTNAQVLLELVSRNSYNRSVKSISHI